MEDIIEQFVLPETNKVVVWVSKINQWLILDEPAWFVFRLFRANLAPQKVLEKCKRKYDSDEETLNTLVNNLYIYFDELQQGDITNQVPKSINQPTEYFASIIGKIGNTYKTKGLVFNIYVEQGWIGQSVHPLFRHLKVNGGEFAKLNFFINKIGSSFHLSVQNELFVRYEFTDFQLVKGRIFTELFNAIYKKNDDNWLGYIHGSAISNGSRSLIFTGASGSGKSTALALLLAHGYEFVSDDVVAIDCKTKCAHYFPAALSVKEGAFEKLETFYPGISDLETFHTGNYKTVRYLNDLTSTKTSLFRYPVAGLIFIKYDETIEFNVKKLDILDSIKTLHEEAWIPPHSRSVKSYFKWISKLNAYSIQYSKTEKLVEFVKTQFSK